MKRTVILDTECYPNYYLIKFRNPETGGTRKYEIRRGREFDAKGVRAVMSSSRMVTFNGNHYDMPMIMYALKVCVQEPSEACRLLKLASDWIILGNHKRWDFERHFGVEVPTSLDHIDLIEVAFGQGSLKLYGGRLHSRKLQDLPIAPDTHLTDEQMDAIDLYCGNDLVTTEDLFEHLKAQIELRELMSAGYGMDLRSKSDAQIAEAVIRSEVGKVLGEKVWRPDVPPGTRFKYQPPRWLSFRTEQLQKVLQDIREAEFVISNTGSPIEPCALKDRKVEIGNSVYRMGIGGLHSSEQQTAHYATGEWILLDRDVASYYPAIVLNCKLFPKHMGEAFLKVYKDIFDRRIAAKRAGHKTTADTLKICLNGSFGKLGSMWSALYSPDLMIQVTVTGQLALLMLVEALEEHDRIHVVSANTDGIVIRCTTTTKPLVDEIVRQWEQQTGFDTEETRYRALFSRDVNNYLALKEGGGSKGKGAFAPVTISKNPTDTICTEAAVAFLEHGTPIGQTIIDCKDVRKFVTVRTVRGGAILITKTAYDDTLTPGQKKTHLLANGYRLVQDGKLDDCRFSRSELIDTMGQQCLTLEDAYRQHCGPIESEYVGKVVRWYKARNVVGALHYRDANKLGNHNRVPNSEGAKPLMELPDSLPVDLDYDHYFGEANRILKDIGARN